MNHKKYRVSYYKIGLSTKVGLDGYVDWDDEAFYFTDNDGNLAMIPLTDLKVTEDLKSSQVGSIQSSFWVKSKTRDFGYAISFIGTKETAVLGISQDYKQHSKDFVAFVSTLPGASPNFKPDGTYDHGKTNKLFLVLLATIVITVCVTVFLVR